MNANGGEMFIYPAFILYHVSQMQKEQSIVVIHVSTKLFHSFNSCG